MYLIWMFAKDIFKAEHENWTSRFQNPDDPQGRGWGRKKKRQLGDGDSDSAERESESFGEAAHTWTCTNRETKVNRLRNCNENGL